MLSEEEYIGCLELLARSLPGRALHEVCDEQDVLNLTATWHCVNEKNVATLLQQASSESRDDIIKAVANVLTEQGNPPAGYTLFEWVDRFLHEEKNPFHMRVKNLLNTMRARSDEEE